jgi:ATP-dependent 26S proteasome regulatory subunit
MHGYSLGLELKNDLDLFSFGNLRIVAVFFATNDISCNHPRVVRVGKLSRVTIIGSHRKEDKKDARI